MSFDATYELSAVPLWKVIVGPCADKLQPDPPGSGFFLFPMQPSRQVRLAMAEPDVMRARPRLLPGARLVQSEAPHELGYTRVRQDGWVLLGLEGAYKVDATAAGIIERCTGDATLAAIIDDLARRSTMARGKIALDVLSVVDKLHGQMLLELD